MALDTSSISKLITEFRALQAKDSITPESLGYILQKITDLFSDSDYNIPELGNIIRGIKSAGQILADLTQGQNDPNNVYMKKKTVNPSNGAVAESSVIFLPYATSQRAGAMRAQQVADLMTLKTTVQDLVDKVNSLPDNNTSDSSIILQPLSCQVSGHKLKLHGAEKYSRNGYVPYLFRFTRKRNQIRDKKIHAANPNRKYSPESKGWHLYGSCYTVQVNGNDISFATNPGYSMTIPAFSYSDKPETIIRQSTNKNGLKGVAWGRKIIRLVDRNKGNTPRMIRLRFALAFGPKYTPSKKRITPAQMVSPLAEFSVIFDSKSQQWDFGK